MEEPNPEGEEKLQCIEAHSIEKPCLMQNLCRKDKRKALKKLKRKQLRKEMALKELQEEEARLNDADEQRRIQLMELEEEERSEKERKLFEERERALIEAMELKKKKMAEEEEEEERRRALEEQSSLQQAENETEFNEEEDWEYIEGPAEVIWKGEEIILKKKMIRVPRKGSDPQKSREVTNLATEDGDRPTSNPLPPQSEAFMGYRSALISSRHEIEDVASQVPNFGTEQDKSHCPFHLKTGACRFGQRCSRVHFYPDNSCTLLIKNMYNGPGLAWEQDEGLEYTDEEVERCYEEFYEDVHTEFLKYGEIVNFKVCKNGSFHLRGNVYVHYKSMDSAVLAYNVNNGRFYAGKQVICEFVNVTRWKVAICGEFMKTRFKTCSHGTACNFIHCFRNPGGDYEWADSDKPPPRYWAKKMASLFGYSDDSVHDKDKHIEYENWDRLGKSSKLKSTDVDRYYSRRSEANYWDHSKDASSGRSKNSENDHRWSRRCHRQEVHKKQESYDKEAYEKANLKDDRRRKSLFDDADSEEPVDKMEERNKSRDHGRTSTGPISQDRNRRNGVENADHDDNKNTPNGTDKEWSSGYVDKYRHQRTRRKSNGLVPENSEPIDGSPSNKSVTSNPDKRENHSDRNKEKHLIYGKGSERLWNEESKISDNQKERKSKSKTDYRSKESSSRLASISGDLDSRDSRSIDSLHSDVLSDEGQEPSISDRYVDIGKGSRWEPERSCEEFEKSSGTTSSERYDSGSPLRGGSKSDVRGTVDYQDSKVNKQNHYKRKISDLYEHRSRRKSSEYDSDGDQTFSDLNSENKSCDESYLEKNPRQASHSRKKRHRYSMEKEADSSDDYQESRKRTRARNRTGRRERSRS